MRGVGVLKTHCFFLLSHAVLHWPAAMEGKYLRPLTGGSLESGRSAVARDPGSGRRGGAFGNEVYREWNLPFVSSASPPLFFFFDTNLRYDCSNPCPCNALRRGPLYRERQRVPVIPDQCPPRHSPLQVLAYPPLLYRMGHDGHPRFPLHLQALHSAHAADSVSIRSRHQLTDVLNISV